MDASDRRAIPEDAVLRQPEDGQGVGISRTRTQRLMRLMGLEAIYPKPHLSRNDAEHRIYPYLLRNVAIVRPNQVWSSDITYVPMVRGWMYLAVVMDWYSRYVLLWRLSNTLDGQFCLEALEEALSRGRPEIFNRTRACSIQPKRLPTGWSWRAWRSAWMVAVVGWTMCLWSGCGGR